MPSLNVYILFSVRSNLRLLKELSIIEINNIKYRGYIPYEEIVDVYIENDILIIWLSKKVVWPQGC